jgi:ABC-type Fe3+ transport system permease subunit
MKSLGSLLLSIVIGIVVIWLLVKLVFVGLKLVGILIGLAVAAGAYFVIRGMIEGPGDA